MKPLGLFCAAAGLASLQGSSRTRQNIREPERPGHSPFSTRASM